MHYIMHLCLREKRLTAALRSAIFCDNYISLTIRGFNYVAQTADEGRPVVE